MAWSRRNAPVLLVGAALVASAALLIALTAGLTFYQDTWEFLMYRRHFSVDNVLRPHNEHIVLVQVLIELVLLKLFGMTSALPEYLLLIAALTAVGALFFVYARRRVGPWVALIATFLLLFVGAAWRDLLWPFELGFVGTALFGLAMLLALDRDDRRGDLLACGFLTVAAAFSSLGLSFIAAAAVNVLQRGRQRGFGRAWVFGVPLALFAVWYLGWGREAESHLSVENALSSVTYVLEGLAASLEAVLGLSSAQVDVASTDLRWGIPLLVAAIGLVVLGQLRRPGFSPSFWPVAAATAANWFLAALNYIPGREPTNSRYLYAGAVFILLLAVELLRGVRFERRGLIVLGVVALAAVGSNLVFLRDGSRSFDEQTLVTRSDLAAIEIARRTVDPEFRLTPEVASTPSLIDVSAGSYLEAIDEYGSPAYTPAELEAAQEPGRQAADVVLSGALPISTGSARGVDPAAGCEVVPTGPGAPPVTLAPGGVRIEVEPGPRAGLRLRRFAAEGFPVTTEGAPGGATTTLEIPRDEVERPWEMRVSARQPVRVCD